MKSGLKRSGKSSSKPPSRSKERSTDKPAPTSNKNNKNRSASVPKSTSQSASRKTKPTSAKTKTPASVPKSSGASTLRATRKSTHATQQKSSTKSKSQSPKSKSASRQNTSKAPSKPNTPKNQPKKPAVKPTSSKNAPKTKKAPVSKSQDRSATPSPKRSETPEKAPQKGKATSKADKQAQKPKPVPIRRSSRFREEPKKPKEAESRSQSRSRSATKSPAKGKASPAKKNTSKPESARMSQEREAVEETKMEVVGQMDLLVPDPVSEFIRDSEGHLVQKLTEQDQEDALRMNLEAILDDENYEVAIKMVNTEESRRYGRQGVRGEQKVQAAREGSEEEDGYEIKEYSLFEDWRLIEAAEAYKQVKGPRGLGSRKIWETMLDPDTGELLFGGRRTMRSLVNRYSLFMAHLSAEEQSMIQELGNSLPEHRMRRLRGQYSKASGKNRLLGIVEQIYDAPEQKMWLNPSTTRNQNAKPVSIEEFVKKSVEKTRGRTMEVEEEEEEVEQEEKKVQMTSRAKKAAASKERAQQQQPQPQKRSVGKESKERVQEQKRSISKERVRDIETEKMLIAQKNYLKLKQLQAVVKTVEEEEEDAGRKKFKNNAGKEVTILAEDNRRRQTPVQAQVQEQQKQPEKRLTKKEKAQMREQRRNEQELKQLKDTWVYDANSLSLSEVFGARRPLGEIDIDPTLSLYVDFDEGFRQFVREIGARRANKVSERDMKWARLSKYAKEYGLPLSEVISIFNRVSCDNQDLELFLNSGDEGLLWTDQEDRDLLNNDQIALRYLVKIKGPLRIKKRREFLLKLT